jgi:hypothetical protein
MLRFAPSKVHNDTTFQHLPNGAIFFVGSTGPIVKCGLQQYLTPNVWPVTATTVGAGTLVASVNTRVLQVSKGMLNSQNAVV